MAEPNERTADVGDVLPRTELVSAVDGYNRVTG